jgi:NADPH:quinone reductase-like Zn-dependent oxidoreductase
MEYPAHVRAWTCRRYGDPGVLTLETLPLRPLGSAELLIRVVTTTVSSGDGGIRALRMPRGFGLIGRLVFGMRGPRQPILGTEVSGVIAAVGNGVTRFKVGERVIAFPDVRMRGHAEYLIMPAGGMLARMLDEQSFDEAASLCFGGLTARHFIKRAELKAGERLLVIGASGAVGSAFVQLAAHLGAHVTTVTSGRNLALIPKLPDADAWEL